MTAQWLAQRFAAESTRWIGLRWGESFPFYYVSEYPKSGGAWLAQMVGDYLQIPVPKNMILPLGFSCVIQNHWQHDPRLRRVFYLFRDGRDVMISSYFHVVRIARYSRGPAPARVQRTYDRLFGKGYDPRDVVRHLPRFIAHEFRHPGRGTRLNWRDHIASWLGAERRDGIAYLSYEELRRDCVGTLGRAIEKVTGKDLDPWRLETTVEKMSMKRQTGRDPGESDPAHHIRKGVVGDWRRYFSREAAEIFNDLAGDALVRLGYETDRRWVDRVEDPAT